MYLNIMKVIYNKLLANFLVIGEKLKPFPLKPGMEQGCPLSPFLFNYCTWILGQINKARQRK
jgi:hypothetical protein